MGAVEEDPDDEFLVGKMKHTMKEHFSHEEVKFCDAPEIDWDYCMDHKRKHTHFNDRLDKIHAPADVKAIKAAQAWLAQHIKNTDFAYRGKLKHETPNKLMMSILPCLRIFWLYHSTLKIKEFLMD